MTEWKDIPGIPGYQVSRSGEVRSLTREITDSIGRTRKYEGRILTPNTNPVNFYRQVNLHVGGRQVTRNVHALVAVTFHGEPGKGNEVRHLDGDPANNSASNLAWGTSLQNKADQRRHGTHANTRKTHCPQGHPYDDTNTLRYRNGRYCRACRRNRPRKKAVA